MKNNLLSTSSKIATLFCMLAVTGCAEYHRCVLSHTDEKGPEFNCTLYKDYQKLGDIEADCMYDQCSANYYYEKAICAKSGKLVMPTTLCKWSIEPDDIKELAAARERLVAALNSGAREYSPVYAAHAQSNFDCWVEQQSENWQKEDIAKCRTGFYTAMAEVDLAKQGGVLVVTPSHMIFFDNNSSQLGGTAVTAINDAIASMKASGCNRNHILLIGRTDKVGDAKHNKTLSLHRAMAVKKEMIRHGIDPHMITIKAEGETPGPEIDGHNRRVDILILEKK
jgi:OOP family OmpA-OmpF porin